MATAEDIMDDARSNQQYEDGLDCGADYCVNPGDCVKHDARSEDEDDEPVSCVGPTGLRVLKEQCSTCIFRPGNLMHLNAGRLKDMVASVEASQTYVICHKTLDQPLGSVCRGSYDNVPTRITVGATEVGFIDFVDGPSK